MPDREHRGRSDDAARAAVTKEDVAERRGHYVAGAEGTQQIPHPPDPEERRARVPRKRQARVQNDDGPDNA